jgi:hypothetical protein
MIFGMRSAMVEQFSDQIRVCYERVAETKARADESAGARMSGMRSWILATSSFASTSLTPNGFPKHASPDAVRGQLECDNRNIGRITRVG